MFRATCLAMFWRHCGGTSYTKHFTVWHTHATAKIVAKQVARAVAESRIKFYFSCNLSRNDFGRCMICYTVKCFVQLVPPQCRQKIARQVARNISQCNSALRPKTNLDRALRELIYIFFYLQTNTTHHPPPTTHPPTRFSLTNTNTTNQLRMHENGLNFL